jgi:hypothetical protein
MKLKVALVKNISTIGPVLMLVDENGEPLPGQCDIEFSQPLESIQKITVTFSINGDDVSVSPEAIQWTQK